MNCELREWRESDACDLAAQLNNPHVQNNLRDGLPYPYTDKDAKEYITAMRSRDRHRLFAYAVVLDDRVIGSISIARCENVHFRTAELGYYIGESYWGRGFATCAVRQMCSRMFAQTDLLRIFAEPYAYNTASCRVLEKAGFSLEGVLRRNAVKNGRILDMKLYARLRDE